MVVVIDLFGGGIIVKRINREVAASRILPHFAEDVVGNHSAAAVFAYPGAFERSKGRALNDFLPENHMHETKASADDNGALLRTFNFFRGGIGGHIKVFRRHAEKQVTHCSAHNVGAVTAPLQRFTAAFGLPGNEFRINPMNFLRDDARFALRLHVGRST